MSVEEAALATKLMLLMITPNKISTLARRRLDKKSV